MKIWKFDAKKMLSVELILQFNSSRDVFVSNFDFFFPISVEITVAVEPNESLGKHPTEGGIDWRLPLFTVMRDDLLESTKQSCYNKLQR